MSSMIKCDSCGKMFYADSRSEKGAYISMTADDPLVGYTTFHLCRKCYENKFPWLDKAENLLAKLSAKDVFFLILLHRRAY